MRHVFAVVLVITFASGLAGPGEQASAESGSGQVKALLLVSAPYGGNYNLLRDVMDVFGWETITVGVTPTVNPCFYGGAMTVDSVVTEIADVWKYDCLIITPANKADSHRQLLNSPEALALVREAQADTLLVAAFCGGTRVLAAADIVEGVLVTGAPEFMQEYVDSGAIWAGDAVPPVLDGNILTSRRGQYYCYDVVELMRTAIDSLRTLRGR
ncbi:MAG: DJ-1/PfpI family protein [bacterium]